jgi:hypothetical protein
MAARLRDPFRVGNEPVGAFFKFEAFVPILADDNAHEFRHVRWSKAGTPPRFELVFDLLDVPEKKNAARSFVTFAASVAHRLRAPMPRASISEA